MQDAWPWLVFHSEHIQTDLSLVVLLFERDQSEVGVKYEPGQRILILRSLSHARAFFYPKTLSGPDSFCPAAIGRSML